MRKLIFGVFIAAMFQQALADVFLEERKVVRSDLYTGTTGEASLEYISLEDWLKYRQESGQTDNAAISAESFIIDDPAMLEPLYAEANKILAQWPGTIPKTAIFLQAGSTTSYNASATPENEIIIDVGVLIHAGSMDEISALLAHELSHILLGHNAKLDYVETAQDLFRQYSKTKTLVTTIQTYSYTDGELTWEQGPEFVRKIQQIERDQDLAIRFYNTAHATLNSRGDEMDADKLAMDLLMKIDDSYPSQLYVVLNTVASSYNVNAQIEKLILEESTGLIDQYGQEIVAALQSGGANADSVVDIEGALSGFGDSLADRTKDIVAKGMMNILGSSHPVPERRLEKLTEYIEDEAGYSPRRANMGPPDDSRLQAYLGDKDVALMRESVILGMNALDSLNYREFDNALAYAGEQAELGLIENPFATFVQYQVYLSHGDTDNALKAVNQLSRYHALPSVDARAIADFVLEHKKLEGKTQVSEIIRQKEEYLGIIPEFYPVKIQLAELEGATDRVQSIAMECINQYSHDKEIYAQCAPYAPLDIAQPEKTGGFFQNIGSRLNEGLDSAVSTFSDNETESD